MMKRWFCLLLLIASPVYAQVAAPRLTFEVASIRPAKPGQQDGGIKPLPGGTGYTVQNVPVKLMIALMYKVPMRQVDGAPEWLAGDRYDIEARADGAHTVDELHTMFQNLLAERFNLKLHTEIREGNVYALTVDSGGVKMTPNGTGQGMAIPMTYAPEGVVGVRVPMLYLSWWLGQLLEQDQRQVIDRTGLTRSYDFHLSYAPILPPDVSKDSLPPSLRDRPSIFDALKQQLGLKLTAEKGPVQHLVIDHVDRPSDN